MKQFTILFTLVLCTHQSSGFTWSVFHYHYFEMTCLPCGCWWWGAVVVGITIWYIIRWLDSPPDIPRLPDKYWGPGDDIITDDENIKPFTINVPDSDLEDLKVRLARWRKGAEPLEGIAFQYGFNRNYLQDIVEHWRTKYDWREREKLLNSLPQYKTQISGLDIHFLHVKPDPNTLPKDVEVVPLLLLHGWPGSIKEFYGLIPRLVTPRENEKFVFQVVAPSLPGYGWSEGTTKPGMGPTQIAAIFHKLMIKLGFRKFYIQGGDWGAEIGARLSIFFPQSVLGYHTNFCAHATTYQQIKLFLAYLWPSLFAQGEPKNKMLSQIPFMIEESGYLHIQSTKPDTVGVGLSDSPVGLAAYILEKFSTGTNPSWRNLPDGGLSKYHIDDLLDNVMIYWFTNSITTSTRLYAEFFNKREQRLGILKLPILVPTGYARFPFEILYLPEHMVKRSYKNLIRFSDMPNGGHFAAFEVPELLAEDVWQFTAEARRHKQKLRE